MEGAVPTRTDGCLKTMKKDKPLQGRNILVTRELSQAKVFSRILAEKGARSYECPLITLSAPADWAPVDRSLARIREYDGIFFTSVNAVKYFFQRLQKTGTQLEQVRNTDCFAVGPVTAGELETKGISVKAVPDRFQAEGLVSVLENQDLEGKRYLFPRARIARETLPQFLRDRGARVDVAVVYETRKAVENQTLLREILESVRLDCLTFTSSSTVRFFGEIAGRDLSACSWQHIPAACIGEVTADTARTQGFTRAFTAPEATLASLVLAIADFFSGSTH